MTAWGSTIELPEYLAKIISRRAERRYRDHSQMVRARVDRTFALLMIAQWLGMIGTAIWITPQTWIGTTSFVHLHVWASICVGALISLPVLFLVAKQPGSEINPYPIGIAQAMIAAMLIHLTGGRNETHFHVFVSLAFLALYRSWRVLILPTIVVSLDHLLRGLFWPQSVFGVPNADVWRWLEHTEWLLFEDLVLGIACVQAQHEMSEMAIQWAHISVTKDVVDGEVQRQTSELVESEQRLRHSELRVRKVIETANDAFVVVSSSGSIVEWSTRAEALFGWPARDVLDRDIRHFMGVPDLSSELSKLDVPGIAQESGGHRVETKAIHQNGKSMLVEASLSVMEFNGQKTINIFFHDIAERKIMQTNMLHAQKMQGVGQLAAGIAHEINTPTQYAGDNMRFLMDSFVQIDGLLSLLSTDQEGKPISVANWLSLRKLAESMDMAYLRNEIPLAIEQALEGIHRIAEITRAMKEFSHPGALTKEQADPCHLIESSATVCRNEWKYVAELKTDFDPQLTTLFCLPGDLSQVLVILIVNAAQAVSERKDSLADHIGVITVRTKRFDEWAEISVEDNGSGIAPENLQRVFEPFFTTKEVGKGTGQGLAIAHSVIVDKHGGSISVASSVARGTTITVRLPAEKNTAPVEVSDEQQFQTLEHEKLGIQHEFQCEDSHR